jgi:hypothetical protein
MVGWLCAWCVVGLGWSGSAGWISEGAGVRTGWGEVGLWNCYNGVGQVSRDGVGLG